MAMTLSTAGDITVPPGVRLRSVDAVEVHSRAGFAMQPPNVVTRRGLVVTRLEDSLVDAWPLLPDDQRIRPVLQAVSERMTLPERLAMAVAERPRLSGRAALRTLVEKLAAGCHSHLEIFGADCVFTGPGMPSFTRQVRVLVDGQTYYLDVFAEQERVDFELDGAAWHSSPTQRERDVRRDAALATVGILTVRYTFQRLTSDPSGVRAEVAAILAARRL